jgi:GNAT superfamily N-acetyltransferase
MTSEIEIVPYRPELQPAFEQLNRQWLEANSLLEPADIECLQDPEAYVLAAGGQVFFAMDRGEVVGTCAAIRFPPSTVELAKLAVSPKVHGRGIGRRLCNHVLQFARDVGATEVELTSNTALVPAIRLYESLGFRHAPLPADIRYVTADVYMTLRL